MIAKRETGSVDLPRDLARGRQRLDAWRQSKSRGVAMPAKLWAMAGQLAQRHGTYRTARALGLEFRKLKRISEGEPMARGQASLRASKTTQPSSNGVKFLEVRGLAAVVADGGCRMALRGPQGEQLQMDLAPSAAVQLLVQLCQAGWSTPRS